MYSFGSCFTDKTFIADPLPDNISQIEKQKD